MNISFLELNKHRNETTFRPFLNAHQEFYKHGINFVENNPDLLLVGQASFLDKSRPLEESVENGTNFLSKLDVPFILFDGQDSSSVMGSWEVCKKFDNLKLVKNVILKDLNNYSIGVNNGRWFWGENSDGFKVEEHELIDFK